MSHYLIVIYIHDTILASQGGFNLSEGYSIFPICLTYMHHVLNLLIIHHHLISFLISYVFQLILKN